MAQSKNAQQLYRMMSEVISLREKVAQAELAAMVSRSPLSAVEDGDKGDDFEKRNQQSGAGENKLPKSQ
jgi:hypothetical protein